MVLSAEKSWDLGTDPWVLSFMYDLRTEAQLPMKFGHQIGQSATILVWP